MGAKVRKNNDQSKNRRTQAQKGRGRTLKRPQSVARDRTRPTKTNNRVVDGGDPALRNAAADRRPKNALGPAAGNAIESELRGIEAGNRND